MKLRLTLKAKDLVYFQIFLAVFLNIMITDLHMPSFLTYLADAVNIILLIWIHRIMLRRLVGSGIHRYLWPLYLLSVVIVIGVIINWTNPLYIIWGFRNNFRFIVFWLICIAVFDETDEDWLFHILYKLFNLNLIFSLFQYYILGLEQDFVGGIFGMSGGGNSRMNIFLCSVLCYYSAQYMYRKCSMAKVLYILSGSLLISVCAELKFFYFEAVAIVGATVIFSKSSLKTIGVILTGIISIWIGLSLLAHYDPRTYKIMTSLDNLLAYANMESGGYNISRMGAFRTINKLFFHDDIILNLFGFGLGNCDTSNFALFNSLFYRKYGKLHYTWFSHQQWFLETGYLGLFCVVFFFLAIIFYAVRHFRNSKQNEALRIFTMSFTLVLMLNLVYNNSIRIEIAYFSFACLSLLPAFARAQNNTKEVQNT